MHGCEALARRWETLLATLDARGAWTDGLRAQALNLLGVEGDWREALTPLDAPAGADPVAHLRDLAAAEVRRHRDLAAALAPADALGREALRLGLGPDTPALAGLRKEERAADRRLAWCRSQFQSARLKGRIDPADAPPPTRRFDEERPTYKPPETPEAPSSTGGPRISAAAWKASHASPLAAWKAVQAARPADSSETHPSETDPPRDAPKSKSRRRRA